MTRRVPRRRFRAAISGAPFLSYPAPTPVGTGALINYDSGTDIEISYKTFRDLGTGSGGRAILLRNVNGVWIHHNDFQNVSTGLYAVDCTNVRFDDNRLHKILGPGGGSRDSNTGNIVQLNRCHGTNTSISRNLGRLLNCEDVVSVYESGGDSAETPLLINDNHFDGSADGGDGPTWTSASGSGIALGDGSANMNYASASRNKLFEPGQVGAFIRRGIGNKLIDNIIKGRERTLSNVGIYTGNGESQSCTDTVSDGNQVHWRNAAGASNNFYNYGECALTGTNTTTDPGVDAMRVTDAMLGIA